MFKNASKYNLSFPVGRSSEIPKSHKEKVIPGDSTDRAFTGFALLHHYVTTPFISLSPDAPRLSIQGINLFLFIPERLRNNEPDSLNGVCAESSVTLRC